MCVVQFTKILTSAGYSTVFKSITSSTGTYVLSLNNLAKLLTASQVCTFKLTPGCKHTQKEILVMGVLSLEINLLAQVTASAVRSNPSLQPQEYDPTLFKQIWSHPPLSPRRHSLISVIIYNLNN